MTMTLADGDGLGGGLDCFEASDEIGLFSVDQGIDAFEDILIETAGLCREDGCNEDDRCRGL